MFRPISIGVAAAMTAAAIPASAATLFNLGAATGETASPGSYTYNFNAGAGAGALDFVVQGYRTLDGANCCADTLSVTLNSVLIFQGTYDLGGGGSNVTFVNAGGGSVSAVSNGFGAGGTLTFGNGALSLLNGNNTITFAYSGSNQGLGDEAWGINSATITGNAFNVVPEPSAWALMIVGFGAVGGALRGRGKRRAALTYG